MIASMVAPRPPRRPDGWIPPGPAPSRVDVPLDDAEVLSLLTGDWRIVQRKDGHRWSLDDLVTAWVARQVAEHRQIDGPFLDIGTGIGSVALMMAWSFPEARVTGVEAQAISFGMSTRSAIYDGCADRVSFVFGDLRDPDVLGIGNWPLVTGTPPYFDDPLQTRSTAPQKEPCRFETRGGVEDYLFAMRRWVAADGFGVVCHAARQRARVLAAIREAGFVSVHHVEVTPKVGRDPLVDVFVVARRALVLPLPTSVVVRDEHDQWTPAFAELRETMGLPPRVARPADSRGST